MRKNREEAYKPDVCFDTDMISIQYDSYQNNFSNGFKEVTFTIINLGIGTAKNIKVKAYSDDNYNQLCQNISWFDNQTQGIDDVKNGLFYTDCYGKTVHDDIEPLKGKYLFSKECNNIIELPKVYLYALKDYGCKLFNDKKIDTDPYYNLPIFTYDIFYQDQEDIHYLRKVLIKPNISMPQLDNEGKLLSFNINLSIENRASKKMNDNGYAKAKGMCH